MIVPLLQLPVYLVNICEKSCANITLFKLEMIVYCSENILLTLSISLPDYLYKNLKAYPFVCILVLHHLLNYIYLPIYTYLSLSLTIYLSTCLDSCACVCSSLFLS